jgi:hypothetical protein
MAVSGEKIKLSMKINKTGILLFVLIVTTLSFGVFAQNKVSVEAKNELPFASGETLKYEGKFSKIIRGIAVADMTFTVGRDPETGNLLLNAEAQSKGTLLKLLRFSFLQTVDSTVAPEGFSVLRTVKHDVQKERVRDSIAVFDHENDLVTYVETDPKDASRPPRKIASQIGPEVHDLISGLYSLRLQPLTVGTEFNMSVSDSGLVYDIPIKVTAREKQKSIFGKVWCYRLEPQIFGEGRLISGDGSMIIWIMDDQRRIPIRSQVNASVGRIEIKLRSAKNISKETKIVPNKKDS